MQQWCIEMHREFIAWVSLLSRLHSYTTRFKSNVRSGMVSRSAHHGGSATKAGEVLGFGVVLMLNLRSKTWYDTH